MAIRKHAEETFVVDGDRDEWLRYCAEVLKAQNFTKVAKDQTLKQVRADYKKAAIWGTIIVTLTPAEENRVQIHARSTASLDIWALFRSPTQRILDRFTEGLD